MSNDRKAAAHRLAMVIEVAQGAGFKLDRWQAAELAARVEGRKGASRRRRTVRRALVRSEKRLAAAGRVAVGTVDSE